MNNAEMGERECGSIGMLARRTWDIPVRVRRYSSSGHKRRQTMWAVTPLVFSVIALSRWRSRTKADDVREGHVPSAL
jgi:hypothetical protein